MARFAGSACKIGLADLVTDFDRATTCWDRGRGANQQSL